MFLAGEARQKHPIPRFLLMYTRQDCIGRSQRPMLIDNLQEQNLSDETLAEHTRQRRAAFGELYQRHFQRVYAYHYARTGSVQDAQDLTTQTFLAALEGIETYRFQGKFAAWLFGIARRRLALHYRSKHPETDLGELNEYPDPLEHPEAVVHRRMEMERISRALQAISAERADAISLCIFGEMSAEDAGQVLGKSAAAVKMLVYRGLKDLREKRLLVLQEEP